MALLHGKMLLMDLVLVSLAAAMVFLAAEANKPLPLPQALPNCPERCGNITITYPFGIGDGCYMSPKTAFGLACNNSTTSPSLNWTSSTVRIADINLAEGELIVMNDLSADCYDKFGPTESNKPWVRFAPPFSISGPKNRFVAVGCDTYAVFNGFRGEEAFMTGCMSVCLNKTTVQRDSCSGAGCCQTEIPDGLTNRTLTLGSYYKHKDIWDFNPCSYAFLVQDGYFKFKGTSSFEELENMEEFPMVVNWQIGNETCEVAKKNAEGYVCKGNSTCVTQTKGLYKGEGYYCQCSPGYEGNPYIGCQDINECLAGTNPCGNGTCENLNGNYSCKCDAGFKNEGQWKCVALPANNTLIVSSKADNTPLKISLGICIGFFVLLVVSFVLYREYKKRQFSKIRKKYFDANGGPILEVKLKQLAKQKDSSLSVQIYSEEDLKNATKNYSENEKIGEGGYGIVYRGVLDNKVVAVKKSKTTVQKSDQFVNEVLVLSEINHRNVVKLLGCCLETKTPILVYEYISNGTLYDHIHKKRGEGEPLSFAQRLKIAVETATALKYLHNEATTQIVHRDIKATNILLDENLTAKVSDFGASKLVPDDETQLQTLVQGTMGYLDPEYLQSNMLTEKSDVYSFGVVLVELLTGENAVRADKPEAERNLANVFVSTLETKTPLDPLLDLEIVRDENWEIIKRVAKLAKKCLSVKGDERPSMSDVQWALDEMLKTLERGGNKIYASSSKEMDHSVVEVSDEVDGGSTGTKSRPEYDASMQNQAQKPSGVGR